MKMPMLSRGFVQIYTGDGKGKTTAALGLSLRALGAGFRVFFAQFLKSGEYSEIKALKVFAPRVEIAQFGRGCFVRGRPEKEDFELAQRGLRLAREKIFSGAFELVVLDELNLALHFGLIPLEEVLSLLEERPQGVELVITGRYAPKPLLEVADLVTEMREVKHYYRQGVKARVGIEK